MESVDGEQKYMNKMIKDYGELCPVYQLPTVLTSQQRCKLTVKNGVATSDKEVTGHILEKINRIMQKLKDNK